MRDTPPREREAYRLVIREIHRRGLQAGDKLPPQETLRQAFGVSNLILSRAMERLVADGVLVRKTRVGTVIVDPDAVDLSAWTVALPLNWPLRQGPWPFYAQLVTMLLQELGSTGCHCRTYTRMIARGNKNDLLADYANLPEDIADGQVDAILSPGSFVENDLQTLRDRTIPVCFATAWEGAPRGILIDNYEFAHTAANVLLEKGRQRIGIVANGFDPGYNMHMLNGAKAAVDQHANKELIVVDTPARAIEGGQLAAEQLLTQPTDARPDGLIVADDHIALGLTQTLAGNSGYRPELAATTHQTVPLTFPLPVLHFQLDDHEFAHRAVSILIDHLKNPELPDRVESLVPRLLGQDGVHLSTTIHEDRHATVTVSA
ncbi:MAG: GntR family transcriptional regulator [Candidatus Pacebacteria bacterium]|nr:GntR family transcriptional regulator [Candidatus Paceibacterota bacterium]